ncbi:hypothetical protein BDQ12DRAFT_443148 [Crucibulum laeve]|uniref:Uncharacterized protein n=1 Tax=Crucibulum laeve TaxID=68775 RepID=A0A5C3LMR6_9AGAR|nr:hypothetical protein BDQ12DRAFT_443148 [Crucibulum laeve]
MIYDRVNMELVKAELSISKYLPQIWSIIRPARSGSRISGLDWQSPTWLTFSRVSGVHIELQLESYDDRFCISPIHSSESRLCHSSTQLGRERSYNRFSSRPAPLEVWKFPCVVLFNVQESRLQFLQGHSNPELQFTWALYVIRGSLLPPGALSILDLTEKNKTKFLSISRLA